MRWLLLCLISVGYAQVLPYTDVNSTNTIALTNKTLDCSLNTCLNIPSGSVNWAVPGTIGSTTPNTGAFTTLSASSTVSGTGFSTYLASPPAIGGTAAAAGSFTTLSASSTVSGAGFSTYLASPPAIGGTAPAAGAFTTLTSSSGMPLGSLASQATNTIIGNATSGSAVPTALAVGGCSSSSSALIWTTNTGVGCNTSINAGTLGGATFANPGAIGGGTAAAGTFTALTGTSGSLTGLTALGIRDTSAAFDVTLAAVSSTALTAGRTLTFDLKNVAHTLAFGSTANTITFPTASSYTVIGSGDSGTVTGTMIASAVWTAPAAIGGGTPAAGNFTTLGSSGLLSPTLGMTVTGGDTNIEASDNHNTNINTGTSTGTFTAGQNSSTPSSIVFKGPVSFQAGTAYSAASWGTTSPIWNGAAMTINDTTASGTVTNDVAYSMQAPTFTSTGGASTTITTASTLYLVGPTCSGGVVCTNRYALNISGNANISNNLLVSGGIGVTGSTINLNVGGSNSNVTNLNTGNATGAVHIADGSGNNTIGIGNGTGVVTGASPWTFSNAAVKMTGITTGTNADTVCLKADGTLLIQAAACTISSLRFKEDVEDVQGSTIPEISSMRVASFRMKDGKTNGDPNAASKQVGLIAENIASVAPECAIYESDMKTPKSYRQECVIALLVKGEQELVKQNEMLRAKVEQLEAR